MKKRIGAVLMGVLLGTSLIGTNVFATETGAASRVRNSV